MRRRASIAGLGGAAAVWPFTEAIRAHMAAPRSTCAIQAADRISIVGQRDLGQRLPSCSRSMASRRPL